MLLKLRYSSLHTCQQGDSSKNAKEPRYLPEAQTKFKVKAVYAEQQ